MGSGLVSLQSPSKIHIIKICINNISMMRMIAQMDSGPENKASNKLISRKSTSKLARYREDTFRDDPHPKKDSLERLGRQTSSFAVDLDRVENREEYFFSHVSAGPLRSVNGEDKLSMEEISEFVLNRREEVDSSFLLLPLLVVICQKWSCLVVVAVGRIIAHAHAQKRKKAFTQTRTDHAGNIPD